MANILTIQEALAAVKRDEDYDNEISEILNSIDSEIEVATGLRWQDRDPVNPIAKSAARIKLQVETGIVPDDERSERRITYRIKQLQAVALGEANNGGTN